MLIAVGGEPRASRIIAGLAAALVLGACAAAPPVLPSDPDDTLAPCPASPNCVSSDAADAEHHVAPFALTAPAAEAWQAALAAVAGLPRTRIVLETDDALHAECRSAIFRFVDDLELVLRQQDGIIAVRSASRLGYSDMGVNRARVETLRSRLAREGVVAPR